MSDPNRDLRLEQYAREYEDDPEFIAEGLSIEVVEEMLKLLRQGNFNQSWLAKEMGVSRAHISQILNAPPNMTLLTIAKIAVALGVRPYVCLNAEYPPRHVTVLSAVDTTVPDEPHVSEAKALGRSATAVESSYPSPALVAA